MATEIDELVTKLSYEDNSKALEEADARVIALDKSQQQLVATTDDLSDEQLKLAQQLQKSKERTDDLKSKQKELQKAMKSAGGGTDLQKKNLKDLNIAIEGSNLRTKKLAKQSARLGLKKRKVALETRKLTKDQRKLSKALKNATAEIKEETSTLDGLGKRVAEIAAGIGVAEVGKAIVNVFVDAARAIANLVPEFAALGDEIGKTSKSLAINTDELQRLRFAAQRSGVETEQLEDSVGILRKAMLEAADGSGPLIGAFEKLGLKVEDVAQLPIEQQLGVIGDALNALNNDAEAAAITMTIFGDGNKRMSNLLAEGREGIAGLGDELVELGGVMSAGTIAATEALSDDLLNLDTVVGGLSATFLSQLVPALSEATEGAIEWVTANDELIDQGIDTTLGLIAGAGELVGPVLFKVAAVFKTLAPLVASVWNAVTPLLTAMGEFGDEVLDKVIPAADELVEALGPLVDLVGKWLVTAFDLVKEPLSVAVDTVVFFGGVLSDVIKIGTRVLEWVDDLVNRMAKKFPRAFAIAKEVVLAFIFPLTAAQKAIAAIFDWLERAVPQIGKIRDLVQQIRASLGLNEKETIADEDDAPAAQFGVIVPTAKTKAKPKTKKQRAQAKGKGKGRGGGGRKRDESEVVKLIRSQIKTRAKEAGERAGARAVSGGVTDTEEIRRIELERRKEVSEQLTTRFDTTGELPAGIRSDIKQLSATPGIDQVGGRVAPPVITITENKFETTVAINTTVEQSGATARQIAAANVQAFKGISKTDIGDAIRNSQTQERR